MKKILGLAILVSVMLSIPAVFACTEPGYSPGYWKGRIRQKIKGKDIEWDLLALADTMGSPYSGWTLEQWLAAFGGNNKDGHKTFLANLFNTAADLLPYED